uniref:Uncharacterized protein n=2 Tax=Pseudomonas viridiflava TaxID=33069 RepID=I6LCN9_PSEVI|nr:hypothetical protein [Pseudomonas viridiflava]
MNETAFDQGLGNMEAFCGTESNGSPTWGGLDLFIWKVVPERLGGGRSYIQRFKSAWVIHNKRFITAAAVRNSLPVELLAGVCWIETGGDPNFIDRIAFEVRVFDHIGNLPTTITNAPAKTSFGWVSIQLRAAALTIGVNPENLSSSQLRTLSNCLEQDIFNIDLAAKHLRMLADHDQFRSIGLEEARVIGARYNRGMELPLAKIKENTSYGNFIVSNWSAFNRLMK